MDVDSMDVEHGRGVAAWTWSSSMGVWEVGGPSGERGNPLV